MSLFSKQIDKRIAAYQRELIETHYREVDNMYRQIRGWRHDYRNHIQTMKVLAANGDMDAIKAHLAKVEQQTSLSELLLTIGGFSAALFVLTGLEDYLDTIRQPGDIDVRSAIIQRMTAKTCETSYPNVRDPKVLRLKEMASKATDGNSAASEQIWKILTQLLMKMESITSSGTLRPNITQRMPLDNVCRKMYTCIKNERRTDNASYLLPCSR